MTYTDPNGQIIDEYGEVVDSPDMPDDAFAVREQLQECPASAPGRPPRGGRDRGEGQGRP